MKTDLNINNRMVSNNSPIVKEHERLDKLNFDRVPVVDMKRLKTSALDVRTLINISDIGTVSGTLGNGATFPFEITLTPTNVFNGAAPLGNPYVAVYQGTAAVAGSQIFPVYGAGVTPAQWEIHAGFDYAEISENAENYKVSVTNLSAGNTSLYANYAWRYLSERGGTATV